jgi:hypothetical protein
MTDFTCETLRDRLDDWVAGRCPPAEQARIEAHLERCQECRLDAEAATFVRSAVAGLPAWVSPIRELWPDIELRIAARPGRGLRRVAVAAVLTLVGGLGLWAAWPSGGDPAGPARAAREPVTIYDDAAADLAADLTRDPGLAPAVRASLDRDLRILDTALAEARQLLQAAPDDPLARAAVESVSRRKLAFLRRLSVYSTS